MDEELKQKFQEKNLEILKRKLQLDISNNLDSLTLSLQNILDFEMVGAKSKMLSIFCDANPDFKSNEQNEILISLGKIYIKETKKYIKDKQKELLAMANSLTIATFDDYCSYIVSTKSDFETFLKNVLITYIDNDVFPLLEILCQKEMPIEKNSFVLERTMNYLKDNLVRRLVNRTTEQMHIRNQTLINNALDNYKHFHNLPNNN